MLILSALMLLLDVSPRTPDTPVQASAKGFGFLALLVALAIVARLSCVAAEVP